MAAGQLGPRRRGGCGQPQQPAAVGAQVDPAQPRLLGCAQVGHGDRVGPVEVGEGGACGARRLAVHGRQHRHLRGRPVAAELRGDRGVHVVLGGGARQGPVTRDRGQHPRLDLAEVGAHQHVPRLRPHRRAQLSRQVVQPRRRSHAARRPVGRLPLAAQPAVRPDVAVAPRPAVRRCGPLRLAPGEQRRHGRGGGGVRLEPPRAGVGQVQADPRQPLLDLVGAAQVHGQVGEDQRIPRGPLRRLGRRVGRPWADHVGQQRARHVAVERQPAVLQLDRQQGRRGLGPRGEHRQRRPLARRSGVRQGGQRRGLLLLERQGHLGPGRRRLQVLEPPAPQPLPAELAVRAHRSDRVVEVEQVAVDAP